VPATARHNVPQLDPPSFVWTFDPATVQAQLADPDKRKSFKGLETEIKNTQKWLLDNGYKAEDIPTRHDFDEPWYWRALEFLRRPQYVTNAIFNLMLDGKFDPYLYTKAIGAAATGDLTIEGRDLVVKAFGESLREQFGDNAELAASGIGLAWDMVMDPLNFIGLGFAAKSRPLLVAGPKIWGLGIAAPTRLGDMAQTFARIGGIIIDESGKAAPHVAEMGMELFAKSEKARKTSLLGKLFGRGRLHLTPEEAEQLAKFKPKLDEAGAIIADSPVLLALESRYGQEAVRAFDAGVLDSYVAARTIGEKIDKGQWALLSVMGKSLLTPAVDKKIYQAGAALIGGASDLARQIPPVAKLADLAGAAAAKGKALFSTSAEVMSGLNKARGKEDLAKTGEGLDQMLHVTNYLGRNLAADGMAATKRMQKLTKGWTRADIMKFEDAFEHPMIEQVRDGLLLDPEVRARFIQTLRKNGFDDPELFNAWIDPNKLTEFIKSTVQKETDARGLNIKIAKGTINGLMAGSKIAPQGDELAKVMKDVTPEEIDLFMGELHKRVDLAESMGDLSKKESWKKVWDEAMAEFTPYGGEMFGDFGKQIDIAEATAKMVSELSPNAQKAVDFARKYYNELAKREMNANVLTSFVEGYSPHLLQPMDHDVGNLLPMIVGIKARSVRMGSSLHREHWLKFSDFVNYMEREGAGGEAVADWIGENLSPALRMGLRAAGRSPEAVKQSYLFRESAKRWGQTTAKIREQIMGTADAPFRNVLEQGARVEAGKLKGASERYRKALDDIEMLEIRKVEPQWGRRIEGGLPEYLSQFISAGKKLDETVEVFQDTQVIKKSQIHDYLISLDGELGTFANAIVKFGRKELSESTIKVLEEVGIATGYNYHRIPDIMEEMNQHRRTIKGLLKEVAAMGDEPYTWKVADMAPHALYPPRFQEEIIDKVRELKSQIKELRIEALEAAVHNQKILWRGTTPEKLAAIRGKIDDFKKQADDLLTPHAIAGKATEEQLDAFAAQKGMRRLNPMLRKRARQAVGDDVFYDDDIAGVLEKHLELQINPKKQAELARALRFTQAVWKGWTLGVRPAFHFRNMISQQIHNVLAGISNPVDLASSLHLSHIFRSKMGQMYKEGVWDAAKFTGKWWDQTLVSQSGKTHTMRELAEAMQKNGVHGTGLFSADNPASIADAIRPGTMNPVSQRNFVTRAGYAFGQRVEDTGRGQLFLYKVLEEGMGFREAAKEVAKWHFDYSDLTTFEKDIRDYVFPFYAWSRKNLPLQMELMLTRPTAVTWIDKARKVFEEQQEPIDYYGVQNWMKDSLPVRIEYNPKTGEAFYLVLRNWIPAADMQEAFEPMDLALQMLNPVIKLPIEYSANEGRGYSFFFQQPLEKYPGQTRTLLGIEMGAKKQYALKTVGVVSALDQLIPTSWQDVVHQRLYGEPMTPPLDEPSPTARWFRFVTGAKTYKDSPARVMMSNEYQYRDYLRALKKEQKTKQERINQKGVK